MCRIQLAIQNTPLRAVPHAHTCLLLNERSAIQPTKAFEGGQVQCVPASVNTVSSGVVLCILRDVVSRARVVSGLHKYPCRLPYPNTVRASLIPYPVHEYPIPEEVLVHMVQRPKYSCTLRLLLYSSPRTVVGCYWAAVERHQARFVN